MVNQPERTLDEFFAGQAESRQLFNTLHSFIESIGPVELRVTKSQVSFRRRKAFTWAWMPGKYLRRPVAPLVLTVALPAYNASPRWKQIVEPAHGRFIHHLEIYAQADLDEEVRSWLQAAWEAAG